MEAINERERYLANPLRLVRALADLAMRPVIIVGEAQDGVWDEGSVWDTPYSEEAYPTITNVERPCATEDDLMQLTLW